MRFDCLSGHRWWLLLVFSLLSFLSRASSVHTDGQLVYRTKVASTRKSLRSSTKAVASSISSTARLLQEEDESRDSNEGYDENGYNNDGDGNIVDQTRDRVTYDLQSMWASPPSEWIEEYWEVLGLAIFLILFILFICCAPICCCCDDNGDRRNIQIATVGDEIEGYNSKQEPILQQEKDEHATSSGAVILPPILSFDGGDAGGNTKPTDKLEVTTSAGDIDTEVSASMSPTKRNRRQRRTLWGEVVSVWSEFFDEMMNGKKRRDPSYYDYQLEEDHKNDGTLSPSARKRRARERKHKQRRRNNRNRYDDSDYEEDNDTPTGAGKSSTLANSPPRSPAAYHPGADSSTLNISNRERYDAAELQTSETPYDEITDHEKDESKTPQEKYQGTVV